MRAKYFYSWIPIFLAVISMVTAFTYHPVPSAFAETDEQLQQLPADQKALAQRMLKFMSDMDKEIFCACIQAKRQF